MPTFEYDNVKNCVDELLALGNNNMKMWNIFQWLSKHDELQRGTQAEIIKLYVNEELVGYSVFENYQYRSDKIVQHKGIHYQDLGVVHFITLEQHRNQGYASLLADEMYREVVEPLLLAHTGVKAYVTATGRAGPLMARTDIRPYNLVQQFYSDLTFESKVVDYLKNQESSFNIKSSC